MAEKIRLQKYIAACGVASRRAAEEMIAAGRVAVNKKTVTEPGTKVDCDNDKIYVDGKLIKPSAKKYYIMLNKPSGYITTSKDQFDRKTVMDLVRDLEERLYSVGRLDYDSEGLLLLTNDGDFAYAMTHPKHHIEKSYRVIVSGLPDNDAVWKLRKGVVVDGKMTSPAIVDLIKTQESSSDISFTIAEGRNRQIRKMCEEVGHPVMKLNRVSVGPVKLGNLPLGKWRHLTPSELSALQKALKNER